MSKVLFASKITTVADRNSFIDFIDDDREQLGRDIRSNFEPSFKDQDNMPMSKELFSLLSVECGEEVARALAEKMAAKAEPGVSQNPRLHREIKNRAAMLGFDYKGEPVSMFALDQAIAAKRGNRQPTEAEILDRMRLKSLMCSAGTLRE